jgi:hypothetical protein
MLFIWIRGESGFLLEPGFKGTVALDFLPLVFFFYYYPPYHRGFMFLTFSQPVSNSVHGDIPRRT